MPDPIYDRTIPIADIGVEDWWEYFNLDYDERDIAYFDDLPPIPGATIHIIVTALALDGTAEVGRVVMGLQSEVGVTLENVQSRLQDFSRKERDVFGNLMLTPRRTIRLVDFDFMVEAPLVHKVQRRFRELAAIPTLYIGHVDMPETYVFGVFTNFSTIINGYTVTPCAATIEEF